MYNPSRGGVRGGADQFTWESVKSDKHRENYLGHSLMAPVGRWQKGKDLSWYAKERKEGSEAEKSDKSELAAIKRAEEEAMLIALGHNVIRKSQTLSKEDIQEALKRNTGERDDHHIERIDGVGASSQRVALLSGVGKNSRQKSEGVVFESHREKHTNETDTTSKKDESMHEERKKLKKKSKKQKKDKKHKKHHRESHNSDSSEVSFKCKTKLKNCESDSDDVKSSKVKHLKKSKHKNYSSEDSEKKYHSKSYQIDNSGSERDFKKYLTEKHAKKSKLRHKEYSSENSEKRGQPDPHQKSHKRHKKQKESVKRHRHDTSESD